MQDVDVSMELEELLKQLDSVANSPVSDEEEKGEEEIFRQRVNQYRQCQEVESKAKMTKEKLRDLCIPFHQKHNVGNYSLPEVGIQAVCYQKKNKAISNEKLDKKLAAAGKTRADVSQIAAFDSRWVQLPVAARMEIMEILKKHELFDEKTDLVPDDFLMQAELGLTKDQLVEEVYEEIPGQWVFAVKALSTK